MANPPAAGPPRPGETRKAFLLRIDPALFRKTVADALAQMHL